jgi:hypothetical protein
VYGPTVTFESCTPNESEEFDATGLASMKMSTAAAAFPFVVNEAKKLALAIRRPLFVMTISWP